MTPSDIRVLREAAEGWPQPNRVDEAVDNVERVVTRAAKLEDALRLLIDKAEQYMDTDRGDLDGAIDAARAALEGSL